MPEPSRVQRWRETKRQQGLKAVTIWLTPEEELRLKDRALQWHCSPSAVMQRALAQVTTSTPSHNSSPPDTSQMRELIQEELATLHAETAEMQTELAATQAALAAVQEAQYPPTDTVTEVVTETLARDLPALVRQLVEGLALESLGLPVTDTYSDATDTEMPEEEVEEPEPRKGGRPRGEMRQRILTLLGEHPEGLSAEQIRVYLKPEKPLGDTLQGMRVQEKVQTRGSGKETRYFVA
jgi:hypothetical protein